MPRPSIRRLREGGLVPPQATSFDSLARTFGVDTDAIDLSVGPEGERGIFAARAVSAGDALLRVPHSLMIRASALMSSSRNGGQGQDDHQKLAVQLLLARLQAEGRQQDCNDVQQWLHDHAGVTLKHADVVPEVAAHLPSNTNLELIADGCAPMHLMPLD